MNNFKIYTNYKGKEIHYKVLYKSGHEQTKDVIEFVLSYPDSDIWGDNVYDDFSDGRIYYKKIYIDRDQGVKIQADTDYLKIAKDFDEAVEEFKSDKLWQEYKNGLNKYFLAEVNKIINNLSK
jgi:hypothetical protein